MSGGTNKSIISYKRNCKERKERKMIHSEWERDIQHNYLVITDDNTEGDSYEEEMLKYNQISGILPYHTQKIDKEQKFYYETGSLIPLTDYIKNNKFSYAQIKQASETLLRLISDCTEYLLKAENLMITPEYVLVSREDVQIYLCYNPRYHLSVKEQLATIFEYFMGCIDYDDKDSVYLVYTMYRKSREETCTVSDLWAVLKEEKCKEVEEKKEILTVEQEPMQEEQPAQQGEYIYKEGAKPQMIVPIPLEVRPIEEKNKGMMQKMKLCFKKVFHSSEESEETRHPKTERPLVSNSSKRLGYVRETQKPSSILNAQYRFETKLCSQNEGEYESITLKFFPYYIGSAKEKNNFIIEHPKVSPYQFKIAQEGNSYFICDLFSKTGTYVNGIKIKAEKMNEITTGDRISFADRTYIFTTPTNNYFN